MYICVREAGIERGGVRVQWHTEDGEEVSLDKFVVKCRTKSFIL